MKKDNFRKAVAKEINGVLCHPVLVSHKSLRLKFISCGPDCIAKGCTSKCCDAPTSETGIKVYVHNDEIAGVKRKGAKVKDNFLLPNKGERVCPFKTEGHLCGLWQQAERPLGCIISPFALNAHGTLIVRNRYKLLPCYDKENGQPAYKVFATSLITLIGKHQYEALVAALPFKNSNMIVWVRDEIYQKISKREEAYHNNAVADKAKRPVRSA